MNIRLVSASCSETVVSSTGSKKQVGSSPRRPPDSNQAIARHLEFERSGMAEYIAEMSGHSPYRASEPT